MINVKFVEANPGIHNVLREMMLFHPKGISYSHFNTSPIRENLSSLPIIGKDNSDLIESFDTAIVTKKNWIYTGSNFTQLACFDLLGEYFDRDIRLKLLEKILEKDNCKKLIFPSKAGMISLRPSGRIKNKKVLKKSEVIPYAFRQVNDKLIKFKETGKISLLFIGSQFVRKGGKQLIEAFETLSKKYDIELNIASNFAISEKFTSLKDTLNIKNKILKMRNVHLISTKREDLLNKSYPNADIFVFPTMWETFGYVPVEAMGYGLPIIATDWREALPEIVEDKKSGFLIKIMKHDFMKAIYFNKNKFNSEGFYNPPKKFHTYFVKELVDKLSILIEDTKLRKQMGRRGLRIARTKFSFKKRNKLMKRIYEEAIQ